MTKEVISIEAARQEWREFLEEKGAGNLVPDEDMKNSCNKEEREEYKKNKEAFDRVVRAISLGTVTIENNIITQLLKYPITGKDNNQVIVDKLVFDKRLTTKDRAEIFKNVDMNDLSQVFAAQTRFCARLTGVDVILIGKVDLEDMKVTDQIVSVFFM